MRNALLNDCTRPSPTSSAEPHASDERASHRPTRHADAVIKREDFLQELAVAVPESGDVVAEHLADNDGLLLHLLLGDLLRMTIDTYNAGDVRVTDRLLAFVDWCLRMGDDYVSNAVAVSFVENFGVLPGESDALLERWPSPLRAELGR